MHACACAEGDSEWQRQWLVQWVGYGEDDRTWETLHVFVNEDGISAPLLKFEHKRTGTAPDCSWIDGYAAPQDGASMETTTSEDTDTASRKRKHPTTNPAAAAITSSAQTRKRRRGDAVASSASPLQEDSTAQLRELVKEACALVIEQMQQTGNAAVGGWTSGSVAGSAYSVLRDNDDYTVINLLDDDFDEDCWEGLRDALAADPSIGKFKANKITRNMKKVLEGQQDTAAQHGTGTGRAARRAATLLD